MKYYFIVGEASGDLHASHLMTSLKKSDSDARFRFFGGDMMLSSAGDSGEMVRHYKELAFMGFVPVLLHLPTILRNMRDCKRDIVAWKPDVVILVDYPGFNLKIAKYVKKNTDIPVYYYISPKIWAWKEWRIKNIRRDIAEMFSILPFEIGFYKKHNYKIHYVGNPTADEVRSFRNEYKESFEDFRTRHNTHNASDSYITAIDERPVIALLAGSRRQEIADNLPAMIEAASEFPEYQMIVAGAPSIDDDLYKRYIKGRGVSIVRNDTYSLLSHATAALVTSGTATLETALFGVPQVVCYKTPLPHIIRWAFNHLLSVEYISLVNLIASREVVKELMADTFSVKNIREVLGTLLPGSPERNTMLSGYEEVRSILGDMSAPNTAASLIVSFLSRCKKDNG